jgi:hypothetical protein
MASLTAKVTWICWLLEDFGVSITTPTSLLSDSTSASSIARDPLEHKLMKHICIDASFVCTAAHDQVLALHYVPSELQLADFFMKAKTIEQHGFFLSKLGVVDPP